MQRRRIRRQNKPQHPSTKIFPQFCHRHVNPFIIFNSVYVLGIIHSIRPIFVTGIHSFHFYIYCIGPMAGANASAERPYDWERKFFMHKLVKFAVPAALAAMVAASATALAQTAPQTGGATPPAAPATSMPMGEATHAAMAQKSGKMAGEKGESHSSPAVKNAQEALNKSGANLKVDGIMGHETKAALKSFQQAHGLKATGHLDKATSAALKS